MPRAKPKAHSLTTEQVVKRMFPKEAREAVRSEAQKSRKTRGKKSTKKDSS
jgi:hypothetical protein